MTARPSGNASVLMIWSRHGPHRKHGLQQFLYFCMRKSCCGHVMVTEASSVHLIVPSRVYHPVIQQWTFLLAPEAGFEPSLHNMLVTTPPINCNCLCIAISILPAIEILRRCKPVHRNVFSFCFCIKWHDLIWWCHCPYSFSSYIGIRLQIDVTSLHRIGVIRLLTRERVSVCSRTLVL
jgi:hypothetical protein